MFQLIMMGRKDKYHSGFKSAKQRKKFFSTFPQTVRPISTEEMLRLQNRYAYGHDYNNWNGLSYKDYKDWYNSVRKYYDPNLPTLDEQNKGIKNIKNWKQLMIMQLDKIHRVYDKCGVCDKKMPRITVPITDRKAIEKADQRICNSCKKSEKLENQKVMMSEIVASPEYKKERDVWLDNRVKGIDQPSFKFKGKFITKDGKRIRIK